jgi:CRISPR-associated protein Cmr4
MPDPVTAGPLARLLFLHAQTSLHPGSGAALGTVDLPVQRERHTQWPTIPGSALKGILRDRCREIAAADYQDDGPDVPEKDRRSRRRKANEDDESKLVAVFGPGSVDRETAHAGAVSLTDARLLAFPVRSLRGVFAWITCRAVLLRLGRDLAMAGLPPLPETPDLAGDDQALCSPISPLRVAGNKLVLEEFDFTITGAADGVAGWIADHASADPATRQRLRSHLAVLSDNQFTHFARHATEIVARVGLDYETKTVKEGALFYQELLPAETLFYSVVFAHSSRSAKKRMTAAEVVAYLGQALGDSAMLQIGGDETIGKGLCLARLSDGKGA